MTSLASPSEPRLEETKRIARVLRIIALIGAQPRTWTRRRLATEFELSERAIDKDLELIRNGLRYDLRRGNGGHQGGGLPGHQGGGYYFVGGPLLKPIELTVPEALALALTVQQARDTGTVDAAVLAGILARLEAALPPAIVPCLRRAAEAHAQPFGPVRERGPVLTLLEQAMAERRRAEIVYATASRGGARSRRTIGPYDLQRYQLSWQLIAHDSLRGEVIMFNVDRIAVCTLTDQPYQIPNDFDPVTYLGSAWGVLRGEAGPPEDVVLRFSAQAGRWVCDERWHPTQSTETLPNGDLLMRFHCGVTPELVRWVLSYGGEVWVEEPGTLRDMVRDEAGRVLQSRDDAPSGERAGGTEPQDACRSRP